MGTTVVALLAGCGATVTGAKAVTPPAPSPTASSGAVLSEAYTATTHAHSAAISLSLTASSKGTVIRVSGSGAVTFGSPELGSMSLVTTAKGKRIVVAERIVGGALYVQLPPSERAAAGGRSWLEVTVPTGTSALSQDPSQGLAVLAATSDNVARVGTATVVGVRTTEYRATIVVAKEEAATHNAAAARAIRTLAGFSGLKSVPIHAWIDGQGRVRQVTEDITIPSGAAAGTSVQLSFDITRYGVPVDVVAPPASQVKVISAATPTAPA